MTRAQAMRQPGGFTLLELLISMSVGSLMLGAIVTSTIAMQTLYVATDQYYMATSDQMRVLDFIALDMRRAASGSVTNTGQQLTLNLPDYIDYTQNPPAPRTPTVSPTGTVVYGTATQQPTVTYTVVGGAPNQVILRTYTSSAGVIRNRMLLRSHFSGMMRCSRR